VDERKRLVGAATDDDVVRMIRSGERLLEHIITAAEVAQVSPDTPLVECLIPSAESRLPLAVVDDDGVLLGVIPRVTLLNALGGSDMNGGDEEPAAEHAAGEPASGGEGVA